MNIKNTKQTKARMISTVGQLKRWEALLNLLPSCGGRRSSDFQLFLADLRGVISTVLFWIGVTACIPISIVESTFINSLSYALKY
jgi:hypothetical protein